MKNALIFALAIVLTVVCLARLTGRREQSLPRNDSTIEYQGQRFQLSKRYASYDAYKEDPENLASDELLRIEKLMLELKLPDSFATQTEFHLAVLKLKFPGYGMGGFEDSGHTDDGSVIFNSAIEIPQTDKERFFIARSAGKELRLVDDFVYASPSNAITKAELKQKRLRYFNNAGLMVREIELK